MGNPFIDALVNYLRGAVQGTPTAQTARGQSTTTTVRAAAQAGRPVRNPGDFAPPHVLPAPSGVALWGYNIGSNSVLGWNEKGTQTVNAIWPDSEEPAVFIEAPDGFLYAVHGGVAPGRKIKRWKVKGDVISNIQTLLAPGDPTFPDPDEYDMGGGIAQERILIGPSGAIYIEAFAVGGIEPTGMNIRWYKLVPPVPPDTQWTLVVENEIPQPDDALYFLSGSGGGDPCGGMGHYCTRHWLVEGNSSFYLGSRRFSTCILLGGRWVAADALPGFTGGISVFPGGVEVEGPEVSDVCDIGNFDFPCTGGVYTACTAQVWGDAWWERTTPADWSAVVNGGLSTTGANLALNIYGELLIQTCNPSPFADTRKAQADDNLPTIRFKQNLFGCYPYDDDTPHQYIHQMRVDDAYVYVRLAGDYDVDGVYQQGGIYRALLPAEGNAPASWAQILVEPDFGASPQIQWQDFDLTNNYLWLTEVVYTGGGAGYARLVRYNKDGTGRTIVQTVSGYADSLHLQTGWANRWK